MNVDITRPCKAKNPATCRYHTEVSKYAQELASIKQQIMETKDEEKFNLYYQVRSQQEDLEKLIDLVEHKDLATAVTNGNAEYSTEVKKLLTAVIGQARRTNNADHVSWNDFIRLATSYTSPQSYGGTIETIYRIKNGYEKVKASDAMGDVKVGDKYAEVKVSVVGSEKDNINIVQIRPHHKLDEYHIIAYDRIKQETLLFVLSKEEMEEELKVANYPLAHGTKTNKGINQHEEYALRFNQQSETYARWVKKFKKPISWV